MKNVTILGSTGSIGTQTLEIVRKNPSLLQIKGLSANSNWQLLADQAREFMPEAVAISNEKHYPDLKDILSDLKIKILTGKNAARDLAETECDIVVVALVGISGLLPTLKAIEKEKTVALANKETLVVGGELVMKKASEKGVEIIPIDSEHSAIFQCLNGENYENIRKILLTSSGGPFRKLDIEEIKNKKASDALKHPNWNMGNKVTIDSSTLMNKGFEVIEARWLFNLENEKIEVLVHPQSIIHSMVQFIDGSIIAQMSVPDMRLPIQYALTYPQRIPAEFVTTDFIQIQQLTFEKPRKDIFPCLGYAYNALQEGGTMPAVLNGANEIAVELYLQDKIAFFDIPRIIKETMESHKSKNNPSLDDLLSADAFARSKALSFA